MDIKIVQHNLNKSKSVTGPFEKEILDRNVDIALIQEPYTYNDKVSGFSTSINIAENTSRILKSYAAIVIPSKHLVITLLYQFTDQFQVVCKVRGQGVSPFYVISAYFPPAETFPFEEHLSILENTISKLKNLPVVVGMDANAKSEMWFSGHLDDRGQLFEELIERNNLYVANTQNAYSTFWTCNRGESNIDVTLTNIRGANFISN